MDAELERILDPDYLARLSDLTVEEVRAARAECQQLETQLSYLRRLVQGQHDIVTGEIARRTGGGAPSELGELVDRLPEILADRIHSPGPGRLPTGMAPGEFSSELTERLAAIAAELPLETIATASDEALEAAAEQLSELEHEVSGLRRAMFDRIDPLQSELTQRYKAGEAHVDDLLAGGS
jgi:hypothetical protein